jgi:hypothetical protein
MDGCRELTSGLLCHVVWQKFTSVLEVLAASVMRVFTHHFGDGGRSTLINLYQAAWCNNPEESHLRTH